MICIEIKILCPTLSIHLGSLASNSILHSLQLLQELFSTRRCALLLFGGSSHCLGPFRRILCGWSWPGRRSCLYWWSRRSCTDRLIRFLHFLVCKINMKLFSIFLNKMGVQIEVNYMNVQQNLDNELKMTVKIDL